MNEKTSIVTAKGVVQDMKKWIAFLLAFILAAGCCMAAAGEEAAAKKYEKLTVGVTTAFSGNFLADAMGSNISDQDIRKLIHSYHLVTWDGENGVYVPNEQVVTSQVLTNDDQSTYFFSIAHDLKYSDGTPITAKDYAFSFLLLTSRQLKDAAGLREEGSRVQGWDDYDLGKARTVSGFRVIGDDQISITISPEYTPFFYEMKAMDLYPLPIHVLAPGCEVRDEGDGIYLSGNFSAELLRETILNKDTGYASHPSVTSGPYIITEYDGKTVWLTQNPLYKGDNEGNKPYISDIVVRYVPSRDLMASLIVGDLDLTTRSIRTEQIRTGMALASGEDFALKSYSRNGLAFISFCGEKGPTADANVRKALAMCLDKETLVEKYTGNMGTPVTGYYGIGQWMFPMTRGMIPVAWQEEAGEDANWDNLNLDGLTDYSLDTETAARLLEEAGWDLNEVGDPYTGGLRYKMENGELIPLRLTLVYPSENTAGPMLEELFTPYLNEAGAEIEYSAVDMPALLEMYYGQRPRDCDMIMLGTNFQDVFDPSVYYDENGTDRLNGITDPHLAELARELRRTAPGDGPEYIRRWIRYLEYRSEVLPEIPLYGNAYMDFHTSALREYAPSAHSSWSEAVLKAYLSDFVPTDEDETLEDGEEVFE